MNGRRIPNPPAVPINARSRPEKTMSTQTLDARLEQSLQTIQRILTELQNHSDPYVRLAAIAENRQHILLAARTREMALRDGALRDFQRAVIDALAREGIRVRTRILAALESEADKHPKDEDP